MWKKSPGKSSFGGFLFKLAQVGILSGCPIGGFRIKIKNSRGETAQIRSRISQPEKVGHEDGRSKEWAGKREIGRNRSRVYRDRGNRGDEAWK